MDIENTKLQETYQQLQHKKQELQNQIMEIQQNIKINTEIHYYSDSKEKIELLKKEEAIAIADLEQIIQKLVKYKPKLENLQTYKVELKVIRAKLKVLQECTLEGKSIEYWEQLHVELEAKATQIERSEAQLRVDRKARLILENELRKQNIEYKIIEAKLPQLAMLKEQLQQYADTYKYQSCSLKERKEMMFKQLQNVQELQQMSSNKSNVKPIYICILIVMMVIIIGFQINRYDV